jgi:ABC-type multidrug transport system permease subunit
VRRLLRLAANDVRLTAKDRVAYFWILILPVFLIWLFGSIGGGGGGAPKVPLTVIDRDGGWLAQAFAGELNRPNVELAILRGGDVAGETAKKATRWIELPAGFTEGALAGKQQRLKIETGENAQSDYSRAAEVVVIRAIARTLARVAELKQSSSPLTVASYDALRARPPLVALETSTAGRGAAVPRGLAQSVPGIMTFTVLMMTLIYGAVFLTIEKREGMLKRQLTLPISRTTILAGKVLGRVFIAMLQIAILVLAGRFLFNLDFGRSTPALVTLLLSYAFAVAGIATFLGAILANPEQASIVGWLSSMVMAAMGGCWWPSEVMPAWLRTAAHVFPTTWAMDGFHALISFGRGFEAVVGPSAALIGFGAFFTLLGARKLQTTV